MNKIVIALMAVMMATAAFADEKQKPSADKLVQALADQNRMTYAEVMQETFLGNGIDAKVYATCKHGPCKPGKNTELRIYSWRCGAVMVQQFRKDQQMLNDLRDYGFTVVDFRTPTGHYVDSFSIK